MNKDAQRIDFETALGNIELKVRALADEVVRLRRCVVEKEAECARLREAVENSENTINQLKEENKIIKLGNRLTEKGETAEMKAKINQMIRVVDKSLALLNKGSE